MQDYWKGDSYEKKSWWWWWWSGVGQLALFVTFRFRFMASNSYFVFLLSGWIGTPKTTYKKKFEKTSSNFFLKTLQTNEAKSLLDEGYLNKLVGDFDQLSSYWQGMLRDFPDHPNSDRRLWRSSIGCTLYWRRIKFKYVFLAPWKKQPFNHWNCSSPPTKNITERTGSIRFFQGSLIHIFILNLWVDI